MSLLDFPDELLLKVASLLPQKSLLNLSFTCRSIHTIVTPDLYLNVLINSSKRVFDEEFDIKTKSFGCDLRPPVVIRSLFALSRFFKNLALNSRYASALRRLEVQGSFPDVPQHDLDCSLQAVFPLLVNLVVLRWYCENSPLDASLLNLLPSAESLQVLGGNFMFNSFSSVPSESRIRILDVSNFGTSDVVAGIHLAHCPRLTSLKIARLPSKPNNALSEKSSSPNVVNLSDSYSGGNKGLSYVSALFLPKPSFALQLEELTLADISISAMDAELLSNSINLTLLKSFAIYNCVEMVDLEHQTSHRVIRRTLPTNTFFKKIVSYLANLKLLVYDVKNNYCEDSSIFGSIAQIHALEELSMRMHLYRQNGKVDLTPFINKLQKHSASLERLELFCDFSEMPNGPLCSVFSQPVHIRSLVSLSNFTKLRILAIPIVQEQLLVLFESLPCESATILRLAVTDQQSFSSFSSCNSCTNGAMYEVYNSVCLVSQEFFSCPSTFGSKIVETGEQIYMDHANRYKEVAKRLEYVRFDFKSQSLLFDCRFPNKVITKDAIYLDHYDNLTHKY
ncbi:hypothetical protein PUMCH_000818 [Australozyma saopauloensis]|uniref:F-box domain-containing protein n=1 Tax=Australozyma saopauloensis TaxID=291208 RepID=A0AAX4H6F3_9ASCO|nr:hypothetical protein PUMCH_000818 [[Candida] saopauloensis]